MDNLRVLFSAIRTENLKIFRGRKILDPKSREIAPQSALHGDAGRPALPRGRQVRKVSGEHRLAAARRIACVFQRHSDRKFRNIFVAARILVPNRVRSRRNLRCTATPSLAARQTGPQSLRRASACRGAQDCVTMRVFFSAFRTEIFEKFSRPQNFRSEVA